MYIDPTTNKMVFENSETMRNYSAQETLEIIGKLRNGYSMQVADNGEVSFYYPAKTEEQIEAEMRERYESQVDKRIREKYTLSQELSILRQKDEKPKEYAEYYAYCEQCKQSAKVMVYRIN